MSARKCTIAAVLGVVLSVTPAAARERVYYFHNDHLGTPQALSDGAGRTVWQAEYEPFGRAVVNEDPDGDGRAVTNNLRFPGQYYDVESGLHYNYHRDYDPGTGRYLQPDPVGFRGGDLNLYAYVGSNPLTFSDPDGLAKKRGSETDYKEEDCEAPAALECYNHCLNHGGVKRCKEKWKLWLDINGKTIRKQKLPGPMSCTCNNEDRYNWCPRIPSPSPSWLLPALLFLIPALI